MEEPDRWYTKAPETENAVLKSTFHISKMDGDQLSHHKQPYMIYTIN